MDRIWTTHHEASHAVVAARLGWRVRRIEIYNFQDGTTHADPPVQAGDWREYCTIKVAGRLGERRVRGDAANSDLAEDEREEALATARQHTPGSAEVEVRHCEERATAILDEDWSVVTQIASSLQARDRIEGATLERLLRGG